MFTDLQTVHRITIWGVGLIGGSLGLALKKNGFQGQRVGLGRNIGRLENALERDAVDVITTELAEGTSRNRPRRAVSACCVGSDVCTAHH